MAEEWSAKKRATARRVLLASWVGSVIEWYDYALYGAATALVFSKLFFPNVSPAVGTVAAFGTFAVGFIARPLGGFVAGHLGDSIGRKSTLVLTLMTMGIATTLLGCLPTYDQIGFWAPLLLVLLRLVQGFAVGGEWGGAAIMAVESAPPGHAGLFGAMPQTGVSAGLILGTGAFALMTSILSDASFLSWGWRVPFLISIVLAVVGLFVRFKIGESPVFEEMRKNRKQVKSPLIEVLRQYPKEVSLAVGSRFAEAGTYYIFTVFIPAYVVLHTAIPRNVALICVMIAAAVNVLMIPLAGRMSDKIGRRPVIIAGALLLAVISYPLFLTANNNSEILLGLGLVLGLGFGHAAVYGTIPAYYCELFPPQVRFSGMSISYQIVSVFLGGLAPLYASTLMLWFGGAVWPVALMMCGTSLISVLTLLVSRETAPGIGSERAVRSVATQ